MLKPADDGDRNMHRYSYILLFTRPEALSIYFKYDSYYYGIMPKIYIASTYSSELVDKLSFVALHEGHWLQLLTAFLK